MFRLNDLSEGPVGDLCALSLMLPSKKNDKPDLDQADNPVRKFLVDLGDVMREIILDQAGRKSALVNGRKVYAERTETPAEARAVADNAAHG